MKQIYLTLAIVASVLFLTISVHGQHQKVNVSTPSPTAATLGLFGEIPVSPFYGLPQIEIPLFSFEQGSIQVPISLSYHAGGVRLHQHPGWVGLNWGLACQGTITRKVNDLMDDQYYAYYFHNNQDEYIANAGFYYNRAVCNRSDWETDEYLRTLSQNAYSHLKDTEPDEFTFGFFGYNGSFYIGHDGEWKVKSDGNIKVELNGLIDVPPYCFSGYEALVDNEAHRNAQCFKGFTITTEDGTRYVFGGSLDAIELSMSGQGVVSANWTASTWYLTKIISPQGHEVSFNYKHDGFVVDTQLTYFDDEVYEIKTGQSSCLTYFNTFPRKLNFNLVRCVYLDKIEATNVDISFERSNSTELRYSDEYFNIWPDFIYDPTRVLDPNTLNGSHESWVRLFYQCKINPNSTTPISGQDLINQIQWKKLDKITVRDKSKSFKKVFELAYNDSQSERLMLKTIRVKNNGLEIPPYEFQYYDTSSITLPGYETQSVDHWGFYHARSYVSFAGSGYDIEDGGLSGNEQRYAEYSIQREPSNDLNVLQEGSLSRILFPTGGSTEFIYELPGYSKEVNVDRTVITSNGYNSTTGGVRIKRIITDPDPEVSNDEMIKEYIYVTNYLSGGTLSSGILNGKSQYFINEYNYQSGDFTYKRAIFSSQNILPYSVNSNGSPVSYTEVAEKLNDGSFTVFKYTNHDNGHTDESVQIDLSNRSRFFYDPFNDRSLERGRLLSVEKYDASKKPVEKIIYTYQNLSDDFVRAVNTNNYPLRCFQGVGILAGFPYRKYIYKYRVKTEIISFFDQYHESRAVTKQRTYEYNSYGQVKEILSSGTQGADILTFRKYPLDYIIPPGNYTNKNVQGLQLLQSKHVINPVVQELVFRTDPNNGKRIISGSLVTFRPNESNSVLPVVDTIFHLETNSAIDSIQFSQFDIQSNSIIKDSRFKFHTKFSHYDGRGNVQSYLSREGITNGFLWGYGDTRLTAKISNASHNQIAYTSFESTTEKGGWDFVYDNLDDCPNLQECIEECSSDIVCKFLCDQEYTQCASSLNIYPMGKCGQRSIRSGTISKSNLPQGTYTLSFWARKKPKSGSGTVVLQGVNSHAVNGTDWEYFEFQVNSITSVSLTVTNALLDELRLYPSGSVQFKTFTYNPLAGLISETDENNTISYFEYDELGRLKLVRDFNNDIVKVYDYNYQVR